MLTIINKRGMLCLSKVNEVIKLVNNKEIRDKIFFSRFKHWQVAEKLGISDSRLSVWLRTPLSDERKARVEKALEELIEQK